MIDGIGDAFYVDDGSGNIAPTSAYYIQSSETASFEFDLNIAAGETSLEFGLFSPVAPDSTIVALSGSTYVEGTGGAKRGGGRRVAAPGPRASNRSASHPQLKSRETNRARRVRFAR